MAKTREEIKQLVLQRMDEISPNSDVDIINGITVLSLIDSALIEYLRICRTNLCTSIGIIHKPASQLLFEFDCPSDFIRLISCESSAWKRAISESELITRNDPQYQLIFRKYNSPSPLKPIVVLKEDIEGKKLEVYPITGNEEITIRYIKSILPENLHVDIHGFFDHYIWYASALVLEQMGEIQAAKAALAHVELFFK